MKKIRIALGIIAGLILVAKICAGESNTKEPTNAPLSKPEPVKLQSADTNAAPKVVAEAPKIPVYVIPELIAVQTPNGIILFAERFHVEELAKKWPAQRVTNLVFYAK